MTRPATALRQIIILLGYLAIFFPASLPALALEAGDRAPDFAAAALSGGGTVGLSEYRGKIVYLDFWASWCAPCLTAIPMIDDLRKEFPSDDFQVVAVNVDSDPGKAKRFLAKHPVGYPSATDPKGMLPKQFDIQTMPTSFIIDRNGVIRHVHSGFRRGDIEGIRAELRKLIPTSYPAKPGRP